MAERIDAYLSRKAQVADASALVVCQEWAQHSTGERWVLRRSGADDVELGDRFGRAKESLLVWICACGRCGHRWWAFAVPRSCARCKSRYWARPRERKRRQPRRR
jgi:hypothetical protein